VTKVTDITIDLCLVEFITLEAGRAFAKSKIALVQENSSTLDVIGSFGAGDERRRGVEVRFIGRILSVRLNRFAYYR